MKTNIRYIVAAVALTFAGTIAAQTLNGSYYMEGALFRSDMNPAFGSQQNYVSMPVLGNFNMGVHGTFGLGDIMFNRNGKTVTYLHPAVSTSDALSGLDDDNKLVSDIKIQLFGAGFKAFGGYNTIGISSRIFMGASLPYDLFSITKELQNRDYSLGNVNMQAQAYAEIAFGHSRQITKDLRVGAKVKVLVGGARVNAELERLNLNLADDNKWTAQAYAKVETNMKGLTITDKNPEYSYRTDENGNPETYTTIDDFDVDGAGIGGFGLAFDLGAEYNLDAYVPGLKVNAAVLDLGGIKWDNSMLIENKGVDFEFTGFHNIRAGDSDAPGVKLSEQTDELADKLTDLYALQNRGDQGSVSHSIGTTLNFGASYAMPFYKKLTVGFLFTKRFQEDYGWNEERLSLNFEPCKWFGMNVNGGIGTFGPSYGWMLNLHPTGFSLFLGMDHMLGDVSKEFIPLNSNASFSMGVNIPW